MYLVEQEEPSEEFKRAWLSAAKHLHHQVQDGLSWLRSDLNPPFVEHLSFQLGNQLMFVFVQAAEFVFETHYKLFMKACREANAIPCIMPMEEKISEYIPSYPDWGLIHAQTGDPVNPLELVSEELIEMSDWELHDFAIQIVENHLKEEGKQIISTQSSMTIDPSIWYEDEGKNYWVVVRAVRYPETDAPQPSNMRDIVNSCDNMGEAGYFASVAVCNSDNLEKPLYRGHGMYVRYEGLQAV